MPSQQSQVESVEEKINSGKYTDYSQIQGDIDTGEIPPETMEAIVLKHDINSFRELLKSGGLTDVVLIGIPDGFWLTATERVVVGRKKQPLRAILVTRLNEIRVIKNPAQCYKLCMDLGILKFKIKIENWNDHSFYSRHHASVKSRQIKQKAAEKALTEASKQNEVSKMELKAFYAYAKKGTGTLPAQYEHFKKALKPFIEYRDEIKNIKKNAGERALTEASKQNKVSKQELKDFYVYIQKGQGALQVKYAHFKKAEKLFGKYHDELKAKLGII